MRNGIGGITTLFLMWILSGIPLPRLPQAAVGKSHREYGRAKSNKLGGRLMLQKYWEWKTARCLNWVTWVLPVRNSPKISVKDPVSMPPSNSLSSSWSVCMGKSRVWMGSLLRRTRNGVDVCLDAYLGACCKSNKVFTSLEVVRSGSKTKWNEFVSHIFEGLCLLLTDSFNLCPHESSKVHLSL